MFCIISMACLCGPWEKEILFFFVVHSYSPFAQDNYKWKHFLSSEILIPAAQVFWWSFQYISSQNGFKKLSCILVGKSVVFFVTLLEYIQTNARNAVWSLQMVKLWFLLALLWLGAPCFLVNWGWSWRSWQGYHIYIMPFFPVNPECGWKQPLIFLVI